MSKSPLQTGRVQRSRSSSRREVQDPVGRIPSPAPHHQHMHNPHQPIHARLSPPTSDEGSAAPPHPGSSPDHLHHRQHQQQPVHQFTPGSTAVMLPGMNITANNRPQANPAFLDTLNTVLSYTPAPQHQHQHHHHQHHLQHHQPPHHHPVTTMPMEWDSAGLIDIPVSHMGTPPSTMALVGSSAGGCASTAAFDFGGAGFGFGGSFGLGQGGGGHRGDDESVSGESGGGDEGRGGARGHGWAEGGMHVPHGDGLWQNLLGMGMFDT